MGNKKNKRSRKVEKINYRNWAELTTDVLDLIAGRLTPMMEDYMAFRGVCSSWRSSAPKKLLPLSKLPLLMLAQEDEDEDEDRDGAVEREFYSLYKREICMRKSLPEVWNNRCIDVGFGWVLVLADTDGTGTAFLFKPFSSAPKIKLPSYKKFPGYGKFTAREFYFITRGILTADPSVTTHFMLLVNTNWQMGSGFWKNGAKNWKEIPAPVQYSVIRHRRDGMLCTMFCKELPWIELRDPRATDLSKPQVRKPMLNGFMVFSPVDDYYLVESTDGEVLLVTRYEARGEIARGGKHFGVMRVDIANGVFEEMQDLGKDAIFVGNNAAVSVDATEFPGVLEPGCIYFTDDFGTRYHELFPSEIELENDSDYCGIYNVEDGSIQRFDVISHHLWPPMWIFPSFSELLTV